MANHTIQLKQRSCPACAAPIPPIPRGATSVQCPYCAQAFEVVGQPEERGRHAPAPQVSAPSSEPAPPRPKKKEDSLAGRLFSCGVIVVVVTALIGLLMAILVPALVGAVAAVHPEFGQKLGAWLAVPIEGEPLPSRATEGFGFRRDAFPALADVNGDGASDLIAPYVVSDGGEPQHYLGAFSGLDLTPLWTLGPFSGAEREPLGAIVVKDRVVVQEPFGILSIVELRTGRRTGQLQLDQNPASADLCPWEPSGTEILVASSFLVDAVSGVSRPKKVAMYDLPKTCSAVRGSQNTTSGPVGPRTAAETMGHAVRGTRARKGPRIEGHKTLTALIDGEHGVAVIEAERGRKERLLLGFDPADLSERWRAPARALLTGIDEGDSPSINLDMGLGAIVWGYNPSAPTPDLLMGRVPPRLLILDAATGTKRHDLQIGTGLGGGFRFAFADERVWFAEDNRDISRVFAVDLHTGEALVFGGRD
ncbi:MAG: hypothetical protein EA397_00690 [Deltaproteobacteria bacterium]|nr:MAG: hypothetical protein EA397_00690 [Deltaproteobacteria bacterium]